MEQTATNLYLQLGVLGVTVIVLFGFSRTVINRMFAREDKNDAEKVTIILNNTDAMNAVAQRLEHIEAAFNNLPCQLYAGQRTAQRENRPPPDSPRRSGPRPAPQPAGV